MHLLLCRCSWCAPEWFCTSWWQQTCIAFGVIRAIYRSDSLVLTMELASCLDEKLLTIGDDSGSFQLVACSPGFEARLFIRVSVSLLLDGVSNRVLLNLLGIPEGLLMKR